jgi:divalent metal cation (Fe/Co/Zn/Cd) transporter
MNETWIGNEEAIVAALVAVFGILLLGLLAVHVFVCWLLYDALGAVPPTHRKQEPGLVWLLLIPCWHVIWGFFVYPKISRSFAEALQARGIQSEGDAGESLGLWVAILGVLNIVPLLNYVSWLAYLIVLILYLVKVRELKKKLLAVA